MAISAIVLPCAGSPLTCQRPCCHSRSSGAHSSAAAAMMRALSRTRWATTAAAAPDTGVEREPYVPSPNGVLSVSPWITSTSSGGMPSSWVTIWANVVSWPWPWVCTDSRIWALPVGWMRSSQPSAMPSPRMSMCLRGPAPTPSVKNDEADAHVARRAARFSACSRRRSS